jgi:hypothetical protein
MNHNNRPLPHGFREFFLKHGRKAAETTFGSSNNVIDTWIAMCGGLDFLLERADAQPTGRKAGRR